MWFKNLRIYRFSRPLTLQGKAIDADSLSKALAEGAFVPCNSQDTSRYGWVSPLTGEADVGLVHAAQGYMMICAKKQEKVLPAAVVNEALDEKVAEITEAEGRPVSRKERQDLKDDVIMTLLPRAFTRSSLQYAYMTLPSEGSDNDSGYIVINAASSTQAEALLSALRDVLGSVPAIPLLSKQLPHQMMTQWVNAAQAPGSFELGGECELADPKEAGSVIRCKHQDLGSAEIHQLLEAGMIVTKLQLHWANGIDFVMDDQLAIKRCRFADNIQEKVEGHDAQNAIEQFDIEFSVMTVELSALIADLVRALGGVNTDSPSVDEMVAQASKGDTSDMGVDEVVL